MKELLNDFVGFALMVILPLVFASALVSFYHMDISLMNPANWGKPARFGAVFWTLVVTINTLFDYGSEVEDHY